MLGGGLMEMKRKIFIVMQVIPCQILFQKKAKLLFHIKHGKYWSLKWFHILSS